MARFCPNDCGRSFRDSGNGLAFHLTWCRPAAPDPLPVVACVPPTYAHVYDRPSLAELVTIEPVAEPYNALHDPAYLKRAGEKRRADAAANRAAFETAQERRAVVIAQPEPCPYKAGAGRYCIAGPKGHDGPHDWPPRPEPAHRYPVVRQPARARKRAHAAPASVAPERVFSISEPTRREADPIMPAVWRIADAETAYAEAKYGPGPDTLRGKFSIHHTARTLEIEKVRPVFDPEATDPLGPWAAYGPAAPKRERERVKHVGFSGWRHTPDPLATQARPTPLGPSTGRAMPYVLAAPFTQREALVARASFVAGGTRDIAA